MTKPGSLQPLLQQPTRERIMEHRLSRFFVTLVLSILASAQLYAQKSSPVSAGPVLGGPGTVPGVVGYGSVTVLLRTEDGQNLPEDALPLIRISADTSDSPLPNQPQPTGDGWTFTGLPMGNDYHVTVTANGFQTARESFGIPQLENAVATVMVFMKPVDQGLVFRPPSGEFVLAPKAQSEVQRALKDLTQNKVPSAQKHAEKAVQLAPGNPYVQYVMGMTYFLSNHLDQAKPYLEKSVSIDPKQPTALTALGSLRYLQGDDAGAIQALTQAVHLDNTSWKAEWYLACAYLRQKKFAEARDHAEQALKTGKEKARLAQIILGEAQADLGDRETAIKTFESFAKDNPNNPNAKDALRWTDMLRKAPATRPKPAKEIIGSPTVASQEFAMSLPLPPPVEVPPKDWAPPDIDATKPLITTGATCPVVDVLKAAETNAQKLVTTLQEFSATEDFQATEVKRDGELGHPASKTFNYYVFIDQPSPKIVQVREVRDDEESSDVLGRVADAGAPALVLAFHPAFQKDFDWKCEGLGLWHDRPAWIVHFSQNNARSASWLTSFDTPTRQYALPLKGRAWVSKDSGQVLHLETDLTEPLIPLDLKRVHFAIDYELVSFRAHKAELWLPENVDTYIQYRGHFLHHYHHYSDFKLFWVGATQKIGDPKEAQKAEDPKQNDPPEQ